MQTVELAYIEQLIEQNLPQGDDVVCQAARYSVCCGGKRFRPQLLLNAAQACGKITPNAEKLACAIEFVHNYSLVHDDLPCMDNDDFRRGKPTCHKKYGETIAVLAGDLLLNLAAEIAFSGDFSVVGYAEACKFLFEMSGNKGMIHGQSLDLFTPVQSVNVAIETATAKTAALIRASLVCGALCANALPEYLPIIDKIALSLGIAYQIADDLADADKCEKSFLGAMSAVKCVELFDKYILDVKEHVAKLPYDFGFVSRVMDWLCDIVKPAW